MLVVMLLGVLLVPAAPAEAFTYSNGTVHPIYTSYRFDGNDWTRTVSDTQIVYDWYTESATRSGTAPPAGDGWSPVTHTNFFSKTTTTTVCINANGDLSPRPCPFGFREETFTSTSNTSVSCPGATDCGAGHALSGWTYAGHQTSWTRTYSVAREESYSYVESCGQKCWTAVTPTKPKDPTPPRLPVPAPFPSYTPPAPPTWAEFGTGDFDMGDFGTRPRVTLVDTFQDFPMDLGWSARMSTALPLSAQGASRPAVLAQQTASLTCASYFECSDPAIWQVDAYGRSDWEIRPRPVSGAPSIVGRVTVVGQGDYRECASSTQLGCDFLVMDPRMLTNVSLLGTLPTLRAMLFSPPPDLQSGLTLRLTTTVSQVEIWQWRPKTEFVPTGEPCVPTVSGCIIPGEHVEVPGEQVAELNSIQTVPSRLVMTLPDGTFFGAAGSGTLMRLPVSGTVGR